jgi:hypothetical protein
MKIDFQTSGGYAGLDLRWSGDTDTATPEVAARITELVTQARLFELRPEDVAPRAPGPPDVMAHRLSVSDGGRQATFSVTDLTAPPEMRPLLGYLRTLARPAPRGR